MSNKKYNELGWARGDLSGPDPRVRYEEFFRDMKNNILPELGETLLMLILKLGFWALTTAVLTWIFIALFGVEHKTKTPLELYLIYLMIALVPAGFYTRAVLKGQGQIYGIAIAFFSSVFTLLLAGVIMDFFK